MDPLHHGAAPRPRLLITGSTGFLGGVCVECARDVFEIWAGHRREVLEPSTLRSSTSPSTKTEPVRMDLRDADSISSSLDRASPDVVIHTAAVNPGGDEAAMWAVNAEGTRELARQTAERGIPLVHVSTDVVHDGTRAPYSDDAAPSPLGTYPQTKAAGEAAVVAVHPRATIVRTSLIYGLAEMDRGVRVFAERLARGEPLRLFTDVVRQPIEVRNLARALLHLAQRAIDALEAGSEPDGFVNVAGEQALGRDRIARLLLDHWQVEGRERAEDIRAADLPIEIPLDLRLDLGKARSIGLGPPDLGGLEGLEAALARCRREIG